VLDGSLQIQEDVVSNSYDRRVSLAQRVKEQLPKGYLFYDWLLSLKWMGGFFFLGQETCLVHDWFIMVHHPFERPGVRLNICVFLACAFGFGSLVRLILDRKAGRAVEPVEPVEPVQPVIP